MTRASCRPQITLQKAQLDVTWGDGTNFCLFCFLSFANAMGSRVLLPGGVQDEQELC